MSKFIAELLSGTQLNSAFARQPLEEEKPAPGKSDTLAVQTMDMVSQEMKKQSQAIKMSETILKQRRETSVGVTQSLKL